MELDQNGAADVGGDDDDDGDDAGGGGSGGGGGAEQGNGAAGSEDDVDPAIKKIIDGHMGGFFEPRRWKGSKTLVCPGDGYWKDPDDHRIKEFRNSTAGDLKVAKPRPAPTYITRNPYCAQAPKRVFDYNMESYALCKKVRSCSVHTCSRSIAFSFDVVTWSCVVLPSPADRCTGPLCFLRRLQTSSRLRLQMRYGVVRSLPKIGSLCRVNYCFDQSEEIVICFCRVNYCFDQPEEIVTCFLSG